MSSLAGLKKIYLFSRKSGDSGDFRLSRSNFKVNFLNVEAKFQKVCGQLPGAGCNKYFVKFELPIFSGLRRGLTDLQVNIFQRP